MALNTLNVPTDSPYASQVAGINKNVEAINANLSPTVLTNTGVIEDKIPKITAEAEKTIGGAPPGWDAATYANFKAANPGLEPTAQDTASMQNAGKDQASPLDDYFKNAYDAVDTDPTIGVEEKLLNNLQTSNDTATASYIDAIKKQFSADKEQLDYSQASNKAVTKNALLRSGTSRYAPTVAAGILSAENRADLRTLGKLQADENVQIGQALQAKQNNDYQVLEKKLAQIKDIRDQKRDIAKQMYDAMQKQQDDLHKNLDDVVKELGKNGAPPEVIAQVQNSGSLGEAVANAGDYLQSGSGTVGEYIYYKRDAIAHGQQPMSYNEYADMDANRKRSIVNIGGGNLSNATIGKVQQVSGQFDNEQTVKDYNTVATQVDYVNSLGKNPTDDIARVYAFAKVMDPNSAVREGEYKTVADYSQALLQRQGLKAARIFDNRGFLTDEARGFIEKTLNKRLSTQKKTYDNVANEYGRRIDKITGAGDGKEWITDYSTGYNTGNDLIQAEDDAQQAVVDYGSAHPEAQTHIRQLAGVVQPDLGRAYTWAEIQQIIGA